MRDNGNVLVRRITRNVLISLVIGLGSQFTLFASVNAVAAQSYAPHKVQAGETLYRISKKHGYTVNEIALYNNLKPPYTLGVGQVLHFPNRAPINSPQPLKPVTSPKPQATTPARKPATSSQTPQVEKIAARGVTKHRTNADIRAEAGWQWPVNARPVQKFGVSKRGYAYDLQDATKIVAATNGKVIYAKQGLGSYRHIVITTTAEGYVVAYEFNSDILVEENSHIKKGQVIATIDKPANPNEPRADAYSKFYFEVWKNGSTVNPSEMMGR